MKAAAFSYERPTDVTGILAALAQSGSTAKLIAGGQSLGPMLNLRLTQPELLIDVTAARGLKLAEHDGDAVLFGACVTHADIEDGRVPDNTRGAMTTVARDIAYRAVRNRGTIGGSISHADPSADWASVLMALGATVTLRRSGGTRSLAVEHFITGALECALLPGEIVESIRVPTRRAESRWAYLKSCRKAGEYAHAMAAVLVDLEAASARIVIGALDAAPLLVEEPASLFGGRIDGDWQSRFERPAADRLLAEAGVNDPADRHIRVTILERAVMRAAA